MYGAPYDWVPVGKEDLTTLLASAERESRLEKALQDILKRYVDLANSGDCGFWDPEKEDEVIQARAALNGETENE